MILTDVLQLTLNEKLQIMEVIWEDFRKRAESLEISQAQKDLLDSRRAKVAAGKSQILAWDDVKHKIGRA